ncbi:hypothetical protein [Acinetobacter baumannii]|uniref:hypothetical protein n=1 Tax=Acinetobacter baumannii TaxID=470 RepID=UPI0022EB26BE|nr:hypothetical protein [Acinetobacter baumannii]MDA3522119.1 hypothetical protein [Acinetobacter baumannii]MDA3530954.1 hypothetical protein [Acinetobacter baumannii]
MDNYKIKVKDEAESKEAQELFEQLGFKWAGDYPVDGDWYSHLYTENSNCCYLSPYVWGGLGDRFKELTLPQLQDLVVLKRNDVKDATHRDKRDETIYLTSDMVIYYWQGEWCKSAINKSNDHENYIANSLTPIAQPQDPALISGADVLRALADGKEVEFKHDTQGWVTCLGLNIERVLGGWHQMRLKPQTIKVELEIPAPYKAKIGGRDDTSFVLNVGRHQYCYQNEEDYTKARDALEAVFDAALRGTNS